ncbi:hypothetical protein [Nocardioides sp.]|uniref:hypothetical protein n=1 Tax=Nocardioides sp. TaxID=35761 RepID=UPI0027211B04|nr:hypothetical protein [Nocardioides sp.]MDO9457845.1 hypothetical protein [Nocardioides sp.]
MLLAACSGTTDDEVVDPSHEARDELSLHGDQFCPSILPRAPRETYGFGTGERATELPSFPTIDEAWLCTYESRDVAPAGSNGAWLEWAREGEPRQLSPDEVASFSDDLRSLEPLDDGDLVCDADLGPRFVVSFAREGDLTGVVVDDHGCGSVRLTDDPFVTVPGDASQPGTVTGLLVRPAGLLAALGVGRDRPAS